LLIATHNGLFRFNKSNGSFSVFSKKIHEMGKYFNYVLIDNDELWIGGRKLYKYHLKSGSLKCYEHKPEDGTSLTNNVITRMFKDSKNRLWIGTSGGGVNLYIPSDESFIGFNSETVGLLNDYISNIAESASGNLLISTTRGLAILNTETREVRNYSPENGFPLNSLYNGGMAALTDKEIFVAGMNGMISFFEEKLTPARQYFNLNLVNLWINNKLVKPGDESGVLKQALPYTGKIRLNHRQSMVTIEFASDNYVSLNQPEYQYKLEGLSNVWTTLPSTTSTLNFMNLSAGDYKLVVRAIYPGEVQEVSFTTLQMVIMPPIWRTWYAYIFYLLVIGTIVWRYVVFSRSRLLLKASLEYEKREKQHIEEVNQSKLRFFTNISHEFRTPLTLISGQIDMMLQMSNINPILYNKILNVKRNTQNMQHLINELLEFRKTEQGHLQLKVSNHNFVRFLHEIFLSFSDYALHRQIKYLFNCSDEFIELWYDTLQLQKVFYNLISNAFKYTPTEGEISIGILQNDEEVIVEINDSGIGVDANDIGKIFDRFYQAENGLQSGKVSPGTGIGLALSKNILEVHGAQIQVSSVLNRGSCFTVRLKKGKSHFSGEYITRGNDDNETYEQQSLEVDQDFMAEIIANQVVDNQPRFSMLIVEDNDELRELLKTIFEPIYQVYTACDGQQGLEMTLEHQPDLVLSDLMMPRLSGAEMCSKIKSNFAVSHIPVVLLTAQTAIEYNIEGLKLGADDYITKPFNVKALITRCNNLVNNRRMLQEKFSKQIDFTPLMLATNKLDSDFIEKAHQIVEKHIDNADFDVKLFSEELGLSRTRLFTKLKGVTGQTPNDFILNVRLKKAAELLQYNPEFNISDITYMLGFNTPRYFTKCFKDHFNLTPMAYRKQFHAEYTASEDGEE
jgi:signal transduction histidine kinase/DNA-binding response OmpR family regulator